MAQKTKPATNPTSAVVAREGDGTIQITITIPTATVTSAESEVITEIAKTVEIPGFRRGNAPVEEVKKKISAQALLEQLLSKVLPQAYQDAIIEHKIRPIINPQIQIVSAEPGKDWQIRAITCEAPTIVLGDYKKELESTKREKSLWVPGKGDPKNKAKEGMTNKERENIVIDTILRTTKCTIPKPLLDEEVNHRLASLVDQTQKLGLTVDQYLAQTGKTTQILREEYQKTTREQLHVVLALSRIAEEQGLTLSDEELEKEITKPSNGEERPISQDQKQLLKSIILRRRALDKLVSIL